MRLRRVLIVSPPGFSSHREPPDRPGLFLDDDVYGAWPGSHLEAETWSALRDLLQAHPQPNRFFSRGEDGLIHGVYVGRGGSDMRPALEAIFGALRSGLEEAPELFQRLRLHFFGTDYAPPSPRTFYGQAGG